MTDPVCDALSLLLVHPPVNHTSNSPGDRVLFSLRQKSEVKSLKRVKLVENAHGGPVRKLVRHPGGGFASCSNDGTVKVREKRERAGARRPQQSHSLSCCGIVTLHAACAVLSHGVC